MLSDHASSQNLWKECECQDANATPLVQDKEVLSAEFQNDMQLLAHISVTNQNNKQVPIPPNANDGSTAARFLISLG